MGLSYVGDGHTWKVVLGAGSWHKGRPSGASSLDLTNSVTQETEVAGGKHLTQNCFLDVKGQKKQKRGSGESTEVAAARSTATLGTAAGGGSWRLGGGCAAPSIMLSLSWESWERGLADLGPALQI